MALVEVLCTKLDVTIIYVVRTHSSCVCGKNVCNSSIRGKLLSSYLILRPERMYIRTFV